MNTSTLLTLSLLFVLPAALSADPVVIPVADHGARINDDADDTEAFRKAFAAAAANPGATVLLDTGTYHLSGAPQQNGRLFTLQNLKDFILEGSGATLVVRTPTVGLFTVENGRNIVIRNFSVRYEPVPFAWGRIIELRPKERSFVVEADTASPSFLEPWVQENGEWGYFLDLETAGRLRAGAPNVVFLRESPSKESSGHILIPLNVPFDRVGMIEAGDIFVLNARDNSSPIMIAAGARGLRLEKVRIFQSVGGHFLAVDCEDITVIDCEATIQEGLPKSGNADFVHFQNCRGPLRIKNNSVSGISDDAINLYSKPFVLLERESDRVIRLSAQPERLVSRRAAGQLRKGDRLIVFNRESGEIVLRTRIAAADPDTGRVEIEDSLAAPEDSENWSFYGAEFARDVDISGNVFRDLRRFGALLKAYEIEIRNNRFENLSGAGLFFSNEPYRYREGLFAEDVVIMDNVFHNCGFSANFEENPSWAALTFQALRLPHKPANLVNAHQRIWVENNEFEENRRDLSVHNVTDFSIGGP